MGIKKLQVTATTTDLEIWLNRKLFLYLESLANPKDNPHLTPNCCSARTLCVMPQKTEK